jgi:hypothetical protein
MRYFFNVHDGRNITDDEGCEFQDFDAVRDVAIKACGEMIRDGGPEFWSGEWRMVVSDELGREILVLRFSAEQLLACSVDCEG